MKVIICGSLAFHRAMRVVRDELIEAGHQVIIPASEIIGEHGQPIPVETYYERKQKSFTSEQWMWQRKSDDMSRYLHEVAEADVVLVLNYEKDEVANYVGANTIIEMGIAFFFDLPIYLMHDVPAVPWAEEIIAMQPTVLHGDLTPLIKGGHSRAIAA